MLDNIKDELLLENILFNSIEKNMIRLIYMKKKQVKYIKIRVIIFINNKPYNYLNKDQNENYIMNKTRT